MKLLMEEHDLLILTKANTCATFSLKGTRLTRLKVSTYTQACG